ncbi:hypothetical protein BS17DRAFT_538549 [Gyrodon lividus]|nr:hypothetical protein BS17DRAFT_538549 [Gyrodon lividus]
MTRQHGPLLIHEHYSLTSKDDIRSFSPNWMVDSSIQQRGSPLSPRDAWLATIIQLQILGRIRKHLNHHSFKLNERVSATEGYILSTSTSNQYGGFLCSPSESLRLVTAHSHSLACLSCIASDTIPQLTKLSLGCGILTVSWQGFTVFTFRQSNRVFRSP